MSRKYTQKGYMQETREERKPRPPRDSSDRKSPIMPSFRETFRCAMCGAMLPALTEVTTESQCPKCKADLHTCKNCSYFDPASRFECSQTILQGIPKKDLRNQCSYFKLKTIVEKETTSVGSRVEDARKAFENLFKK